jgi:hypothetical protein
MKTKVYTTFDSANRTWNVMDYDNNCLFYGNIEQLEDWLDTNKGVYYE